MTTVSGKKHVKGATGLMALASKSTKTAAAKKDEKEEIVPQEQEVADAIDRYVTAKEQIQKYTGILAEAESIVKPAGKDILLDDLKKTTKLKESFVLVSKNKKISIVTNMRKLDIFAIDENSAKQKMSVMLEPGEEIRSATIVAAKPSGLLYIVQDSYKYANLDEERVEYLQETLGEDIISTKNEFIINPELVDKYGQILCDFIKKSKDITAEDKELLIQLKQQHRIAKGTIDNLLNIEKSLAKTSGLTVEAIFEEVQPTQQLKVRGK